MKKRGLLLLACLFLLSLSAAQAETVIPPAYEVPEYVTWLLDVAIGELGNGEDKHGVTKYGEWAGEPKAQWCAEFLCWSVDQVDKRYGTQLLNAVYPLYSSSNVGRNFFIKKGRYITRNGNLRDWGYQWYIGDDHYLEANSYVPQPGDWMFFTWNSGYDTDHVAMVEYCSQDAQGNCIVHVIEGNNPSKVARNSYRQNDKKILGYGTVHDLVDWTLRYPNESEKVRTLQKRLAYIGYFDDANVDGVFGQKTIAAVNAFQQEQMEGKRANGMADISTQNALRERCLLKLRSDSTGFLVIDEEE